MNEEKDNPLIIELVQRVSKLEERVDGLEKIVNIVKERMDGLEQRISSIDFKSWLLLTGVATAILLQILLKVMF